MDPNQQNPTMNPNQILHCREDSDSQMQSLFDVVLNPQQAQQTPFTPFRSRNLPKSFFEQPTKPSHSRESSQDSTPGYLQLGLGPKLGRPNGHPGLTPDHSRSQSLPAQLSLPLSVPPLPQPQHNKQASVDVLEDMAHLHIPSGPGPWDPVKNTQISSQEQLSWPKSVSTNTLNATQNTQGGHTPQGTLSPAQSHTSSPNVSIQNLGPLPQGWEQGFTPDGEVYFIDHVNRKTTWQDPRLPKHLQRPGPMKLNQPPINIQPLQTLSQQLNNPPPPLLNPPPPQLQQPPPNPQPPTLAQQPQPPQQQISPGQQQPPQPQQQTLQPTQPQVLRQPPQLPPLLPPLLPTQQPPQQNPEQPPTSTSGQNPQFIQFELERLKQEKDRLHREQEEIARREMLLKEMMSLPKHPPHSENQPTPNPPTSIQSVSTSGVDPFLGSNNLESHARQNSGDSGLGGMGNSYSLPRTPEDFLSNVDEMDTHETAKQAVKPQSSDFNMNDLQSNMCMDMASLGDPDQTGMESEDLVPSLEEDIGSLSNVLLNDVEVGKMENLLWL